MDITSKPDDRLPPAWQAYLERIQLKRESNRPICPLVRTRQGGSFRYLRDQYGDRVSIAGQTPETYS